MVNSTILKDVKKYYLDVDKLSSINGVKPAKVNDNVLNGIKHYYQKEINLTNKDQYRERIKRLYDNLSYIKPLDASINNVIYSKNYLEKGISIKSNINYLKQIWVEYRLIYNELNKNKVKKLEVLPNKERNIDNYMDQKESYVLKNFDEIFDKLNKQVDGTSKYVEELKQMKEKVSTSTTILESSKKAFEQKKGEFESYLEKERQKLDNEYKEFEAIKKAQELKIENEKEKLDKNYKKLQELVEKFNQQVNQLIGK